jgi:anti-sigma28 factor (negative regulator of flagellin synthesis)
MSIPIGAAGLSFSNLTEIRDSAKTLMALASATGMDAETESLSMSLLRKIDSLSGDISPDDMMGIERVFSKLKQHLEEVDPNLAALMVGSMSAGASVLDSTIAGIATQDGESAMDFEQKRSGAGAAAWVQIQHAQVMDAKRSGDADALIHKIQKQMNTQSVANSEDVDVQDVMSEIKAALVDGIQDMDEIRLLKKLLGSVPGLIMQFPNLLDDLKSAVTEFVVGEIRDMSPEDARLFIREVVGMLSEAVGGDLLSDEEIDTLVDAVHPPEEMLPTSDEDSVDGGAAVPTLTVASVVAKAGPVVINPLLMQGGAMVASPDMKMKTAQMSGISSEDRGRHTKDPMERVKEIVAALERVFSESLHTSGDVLETVLSRLQKASGG